jgi:hypothetical protein
VLYVQFTSLLSAHHSQNEILYKYQTSIDIIRRNTTFLIHLFGSLWCTVMNSAEHVSICAGIIERSMWARNRGGICLSYRPARLHSLAESIPGLLKSLKIQPYNEHIAPIGKVEYVQISLHSAKIFYKQVIPTDFFSACVGRMSACPEISLLIL